MRVCMLRTMRGSDDGFTVREYKRGHPYELGHSDRARELAQVFVREGWAVEVTEPSVVMALVPTRRLPLVEEYVAAGYPADSYQRMLAQQTAEAAAAGQVVEVRALTAAEQAEAAAANMLREGPPAVEGPPASPMPPPTPPPAPVPSPPAKRKKR